MDEDDYLWTSFGEKLEDLDPGSYPHFLEALRLECGAQHAGLVASFAYEQHTVYSGLKSMGLEAIRPTIDELINHIRDAGLEGSESAVKFTVGYFGGSGSTEFPEWTG
jgi:hypothetical protein